MRNTSRPRFSFAITILLILSSNSFVLIAPAQASREEAYSALVDAETSVVSAYKAVLEAEQAGGNVSVIVGRLAEAGGFLADAQMAFRSGNFTQTVQFANQSKNIGAEVQTEASRMKDSAWIETVQRLWLMMMVSISFSVLIVLGSVWAWRVFKRRYYKHVLGMKPEVSSGES